MMGERQTDHPALFYEFERVRGKSHIRSAQRGNCRRPFCPLNCSPECD